MDSAWLRQRKKDRKLTDQIIADAVGRERSVVNKVLGGKAAFQVEILAPLAQALGASKEEVLFRFGVLDRLPVEDRSPPEPPSIATLEKMLEEALFGFPPGTALSAYPSLAAPELREQLALYLAGFLDDQNTEQIAPRKRAQRDPEQLRAAPDAARN